jgi:hypothetical protein
MFSRIQMWRRYRTHAWLVRDDQTLNKLVRRKFTSSNVDGACPCTQLMHNALLSRSLPSESTSLSVAETDSLSAHELW